jgi:ABC-type sugar transport system ATPase subunit
MAILLISEDLDEILGLADRIAVMYEGEIVGVVPPDTELQDLGLMMAGAKRINMPVNGGNGNRISSAHV